ncbi:MAG: hypothetical protein ACFFDW_11595, partial [Candidatus Thorarchaeota archaeon]
SGYANLDYSFPLSSSSGLHTIEAEWLGFQVPTYDLRKIYYIYEEWGVIVTGTVDINSFQEEKYDSLTLNNSINHPLFIIEYLVSDLGFTVKSFFISKETI